MKPRALALTIQAYPSVHHAQVDWLDGGESQSSIYSTCYMRLPELVIHDHRKRGEDLRKTTDVSSAFEHWDDES